jgi:hypothetical protein
MQTPYPCRRCMLEDLPGEQPLRELVLKRIALIPDGERTGDTEYAGRLALCRGCEQLNRGTCAQCGCYVEIRAAKRALHCAHANPKW